MTLEGPDAYYQIAYLLSANGQFYATGTNIREKDGKLNRDQAGEVVFWQTLKPAQKKTHKLFQKKFDIPSRRHW